MALRSALEDFEGTTLAAIPGLLGKLHYLARLHDGCGNYLHWGMGRTYGEEAAGRAIRASHGAVLTQVLRTPLRRLAEDLSLSASGGQVTARDLLLSLEKLLPQALPDRSLVATQKHLTTVLHALSSLLQNPELATPPDASPPPPLVQ